MSNPRVYLAGPDVFLPDPTAWMERKKAICSAHGLAGVSPLDALDAEPPEWDALPEWRRIALRNEAHIRSCAAIVANLTPFRGPSADVGTVYEVGFARGLGRPVFGYATVTASFHERTLACVVASQDQHGAWWDQDGLLLEQFGLFDNLMIEGGLAMPPVRENRDRWHDLSVFEACIEAAARRLKQTDKGLDV